MAEHINEALQKLKAARDKKIQMSLEKKTQIKKQENGKFMQCFNEMFTQRLICFQSLVTSYFVCLSVVEHRQLCVLELPQQSFFTMPMYLNITRYLQASFSLLCLVYKHIQSSSVRFQSEQVNMIVGIIVQMQIKMHIVYKVKLQLIGYRYYLQKKVFHTLLLYNSHHNFIQNSFTRAANKNFTDYFYFCLHLIYRGTLEINSLYTLDLPTCSFSCLLKLDMSLNIGIEKKTSEWTVTMCN